MKRDLRLLAASVVLILSGGALTALHVTFLLVTGFAAIILGVLLYLYWLWLT